MAWPPPVNPGDEILSQQYNALLQSQMQWGGDVNAGGFKLSNVLVSATRQTVTLTSNFTIPSGGYGTSFIIVDATAGNFNVTLPTAPQDGETYTFTRVDGVPGNNVFILAGTNVINIWPGDMVSNYYVFQYSSVMLTWTSKQARWEIASVTPSAWLVWIPQLTAIDSNNNIVATVTINDQFNSNWQAMRGQTRLVWSGHVTLTQTGGSPPIYIHYTAPVNAAMFLGAPCPGVGIIDVGNGSQPCEAAMFTNVVDIAQMPHAPLPTGKQIYVNFNVAYPIDY